MGTSANRPFGNHAASYSLYNHVQWKSTRAENMTANDMVARVTAFMPKLSVPSRILF